MKDNNKVENFFGEQFLTSSKYRFWRHLFPIFAIVLLNFWEMKDIYQEGSRWFPVMKSSVIALSVIYLNIYVLAPRFLLKKWYWVYLLTMIYAILAAYFVEIQLNDVVYTVYNPKIRELYGKVEINPLLQVFTSVVSLGVIVISSSVIIVFRQWMQHDLRLNKLEKEAMQTELKQLKKQINPQFLAQALEKASGLAVEDKETTTSILLKLASMLRYQLYDSVRDSVLLNADIQFLTDFLNLEKICRPNFRFSIESKGDMNLCLVPPLLFMPIVEWAVSGNGANDDSAFVRLNFCMDDAALKFECQSFSTMQEKGLTDIHRRLILVYGHLYSLETDISEEIQTVRLCLYRPADILKGNKSVAT